ncbi:hypothetical protein PG993_002720 [Apiospora rasikravindrae]|uniref:Uncharacterized protein n=1 Tax=Apiospora rasikravindrae TaxID=990691 RepID=A0ABR1TZN4_9PEZI
MGFEPTPPWRPTVVWEHSSASCPRRYITEPQGEGNYLTVRRAPGPRRPGDIGRINTSRLVDDAEFLCHLYWLVSPVSALERAAGAGAWRGRYRQVRIHSGSRCEPRSAVELARL